MSLDTLRTFDQSDKKTKRQREEKTEIQKRQRPEREFNIVMSGHFALLRCLYVEPAKFDGGKKLSRYERIGLLEIE